MAKTQTLGANSATTKNDPDFKSAAYMQLAPAWKVTQDLWGSSLDIRAQGEEYLPKFKKEPAEKYEERKAGSVFENDFRLSIETWAGMVFRKDPKPAEVDPLIDEMFTDIDLCGNSLWKFLLDAFEMYLRDGNGYIYVDAPPVPKEITDKLADGQKPTLADREGDRPYWVFYKASQVLKTKYVKKGSREILSQATIKETTIEDDGEFGEKEVTRIRRLNIGSYQMYEKTGRNNKWVPTEDNGTTGLDYIPLFPIADMFSQPPMLTLGLLCILAYNQKSDYDNICHLVCTPREVRRYDSKEDAAAATKIQTASPGVGIKGWGQHFEVKYAEVTGSGMDKARDRYKDVEQQIARIGVGMLAPSEAMAVKTATQVIDDADTRQSKLARLTRDFENCVEKALYATAEIINSIRGKNTINLDNAEQKAKLKLQIDYDRLTFSMDQLQFFSDLVDSGKLSLDTFLKWLDQVMEMPADFDPAVELKKIAAVNRIITEEPPKDPETKPAE